jgi:hypothetical protein
MVTVSFRNGALYKTPSPDYDVKRGGAMDAEPDSLDHVLQRTKDRYRLLTENVRDVIFTLDLNLRYTYCSPSEVKESLLHDERGGSVGILGISRDITECRRKSGTPCRS